MAPFIMNDLYALDKGVENNIEIFNFHTPKLDKLSNLKKIEEKLITEGVITFVIKGDISEVEVEFKEVNEWDKEFCKDKTYTDEYGYLRWNHDDKLVHRDIAYKYIYLENLEDYPMPMAKYQVHHKDGNKKNNAPENLSILTAEEHKVGHRIRK